MKKEGFTLVELLAVIVILALLIVITANTVLPMMNKTKKNAMLVYAEKVLDKASAAYMIDSMTNGGISEYYSIEALTGQSDYFGVVKVSQLDNNYSYSIAMFDKREEIGLKISALDSIEINEDIDSVVLPDNYNSEEPENFDIHEKVKDYNGFATNLIKYADVTEGIYIIYNSGQEKDFSSYVSSGFIKVTSGKKYKYSYYITSSPNFAGYAWYDKDKNYLEGFRLPATSSLPDKSIEITAPPNAEYLRVSWPVSTSNPNWKMGTVKLELLD